MSHSRLLQGRLGGDQRVLCSDGLPRLIAESPAMQPVVAVVEGLARADANVLITGEHGTGKEVLARWLHAMSDRGGRPLVPVRAGVCVAFGLETTLVGDDEEGGGCLELAEGGTLFLDGITSLTLDQQADLIGALSGARRRNVRIISATDADPAAAIREGRILKEVLDLLAVTRVHVPPLRDRRADVPHLADHFLKRHSANFGRTFTGFSTDAITHLIEYSWPGNVRELDHVIDRAVMLASGDTIGVGDLAVSAGGREPVPFESMTLSAVERILIQKALQRHDGNVSRAARSLGLSRSALYRRLHRHGL